METGISQRLVADSAGALNLALGEVAGFGASAAASTPPSGEAWAPQGPALRQRCAGRGRGRSPWLRSPCGGVWVRGKAREAG